MEGTSLKSNLLGLLKSPVTAFKERAQEKNIKIEGIIALALAILIALLTILNIYITTIKEFKEQYVTYSKYKERYSYLSITKEEYEQERKDAKKALFKYTPFSKIFFRTAGITIGTNLVLAALLYIISRLVKSPKDYLELLSLTNSAFILFFIGLILSVIFSYIYAPIGIILMFGLTIFAIFALANSFRESMELEDTNKFVIFSTLVFTILFAILLFAIINYVGGFASLELFDI